jgi:glycosyltransferase involved in cell wall biosynthesis
MIEIPKSENVPGAAALYAFVAPGVVRPVQSSPPIDDSHLSPVRQGVSIVIPAYNESGGIGPSLRDLLAALDAQQNAPDVEVILVDDGSTDDTAAQARLVNDERLKVVSYPENRGYGAAIKAGMHKSRYSWIAITDADGTYPAKHLETLFAMRGDNDMVVGARITKDAQIPLVRRPAKWVLKKLASFLIQREIPDLNSGMRVMRRPVVERYERLLPNQFSFTTTITLVMLSAGFSVHYEPIEYKKRYGSSKIHPIHDTINFVTLIIRTILYFNPLRVFIPLSLLFILAAFLVAVGSYLLTPQLMDVTTVLLFVTAVQLLAIGMLADLINRRST